MAFVPVAGYNARLYFGKYNLGQYFSSLDADTSAALVDATTFGQSAHVRAALLHDASIKGSGYWDPQTGAIHTALTGALGAASGSAVTFGPGGDTVAAPALLGTAREGKWSLKESPTSLVAADMEVSIGQGRAPALAIGQWMIALGVKSASGQSAVWDAGADSATGWRATLHCTAVTGGASSVIKLQHSQLGVVYSDVTGGQFTTVTAATGEILASASATTPLYRYRRIDYTVAGGSTVTIAVAVAQH